MESQVYVIDITCVGEELLNRVSLPMDLSALATRYQNESARYRSLCAYSLLVYKAKELGLGIEPITISEHGKPDFKSFHFNLSHSGDMVALMISDVECGVDIQVVEQQKDYDSLAKRVLSPALYSEYLSSNDKPSFFVKAWAIAEALWKKEGTGLVRDELILNDVNHPAMELLSAKHQRYFYSFCPFENVVIHPLFQL